jgi:hypothetical protein
LSDCKAKVDNFIDLSVVGEVVKVVKVVRKSGKKIITMSSVKHYEDVGETL